MDIGKAFTYPFDDEDWLKKLAITGLLGLVPILGNIAVGGWVYETSRKIRAGDPKPLTSWDDFGAVISKGIPLFLAALTYAVPALLGYCVIWAATLLTVGAAGASKGGSNALGGILVVLIPCIYCLMFFYGIAAFTLYVGGYMRYFNRPEFGTFLQFADNFGVITRNVGDVLIAVLFLWLGGLVTGPLLICCLFPGVAFNAYYSSYIIGSLSKKLSPMQAGM